MPSLELEFEVFCGRCGDGLCNNTRESASKGRRFPSIQVDPCERCLERAKDEGINSGYDAGYADGQKEAAA